MRPTALVTGASRGIGKATAVALADAGYDVVITARTVREGTAISPESGGPLPGSLDTTCAAVTAVGGRAVPIVMDLLDLDDLAPAVDRAVHELGGRLDLLVNNAIFTGPGNDVRFAEVDPVVIRQRVTGNLTAQLLITHQALQHMLASGGGTVIDITSGAGQHTPRQPAGEGGWSLVYAATKAGFHRIADMLALEYGPAGIRALNVNPGFVATERVLAAGDALAFVARHGIEPEVVGRVVAWLVGPEGATVANGSYVQAVDLAREIGLLPAVPTGATP